MKQVSGDRVIRHSLLWGTAGGASLISVYFLVLTISNSLEHALEELGAIGVWIALLTVGFGIQTGLFVYVRRSLKARGTVQATASMAAAGGVSTTAMVACCLHHLTDFLPILGVSAASLFLIRYQIVFLAIGAASNLIGITVMLRLVQRQELYEPGHGALGRILKLNMNRVLVVNTLLGAAVAAAALVWTP